MARRLDKVRNVVTEPMFLLNKRINDNVYIYLMLHSRYNSEEGLRVIDRAGISVNKISKDLGISRVTVGNTINELKKICILEDNGYGYYLKNISNNNIYVEASTLEFIESKRTRNMLKVYSLLCLYWKYKERYKKSAYFTKRSLLRDIGYNYELGNNYKVIDKILKLLEDGGYLRYHKETEGGLIFNTKYIIDYLKVYESKRKEERE